MGNNKQWTIVKVELEDTEEILQLINDYTKDNNILFDYDTVERYVISQLTNFHCYAFLVKGDIIGVITFAVMPHPFNSKILISRKLNCLVHKNYRKKGIGKMLIEYAEDISRKHNATKFYFSSPVPIGEDYKVYETDYVKEL